MMATGLGLDQIVKITSPFDFSCSKTPILIYHMPILPKNVEISEIWVTCDCVSQKMGVAKNGRGREIKKWQHGYIFCKSIILGAQSEKTLLTFKANGFLFKTISALTRIFTR